MNVAELGIDNLSKNGSYDSLYFDGRWITNEQMIGRGNQVAAGLADMGVRRGDRVATVLSNRPEVLQCFVGCFMAGAWNMPVMFTLTATEIGFLFEDAAPTVVITERLFLSKVLEARRRAPSIREVVIVDSEPAESAITMGDWLDGAPLEYPMVSCDPDDVALLMYTSGTTGRPKGVMISHDNLMFTAISSAKARGIVPGERNLSCLPLNHSYGIILWASTEHFGIKNVLMPRFDPEELLRHVQEFQTTATSLVPTMMIRMLALPNVEDYDLSSLKRWGCAAAPLPVTLLRAFEARFPGKVIEAYGLTECSPTVTVSRMDMAYKEGAAGVVIEGVEVTIQDPMGKSLAAGVTGEVCVRGKNVMKGYYNRPEATAEVMRGEWLRTGDAGYVDEEGYLFITDRFKDLIIRGGENIFPADIEEVLIKHPRVSEAAVIGAPDADFGEVVMAVIVPAPGTKPAAEEIASFCRGRLGKFQVPQRIEFAESLPKTAIGKMLKRELRKQYFE